MKKILLILGVALLTSGVHSFLGIVGTQHASIRFMVRENALLPSGNAHLSPEMRERFVESQALQNSHPNVQNAYKDAIRDARKAIAASRRSNAFLTLLLGSLFVGAGILQLIDARQRQSNKTQEGIGEELAKPSE